MKKRYFMIGLNTIFVIVLFTIFGVNGQSQKEYPNVLNDTVKPVSKSSPDTTCVIPDVPAEYTGGIERLQKFIQTNLKYPDEALELGIEGNVLVEFVVEPTGELSNIKIVKPLHKECDKEVIRLIKKMPKWIPAKKNNNFVRTTFRIPVYFSS
ncbi:energy transducer TonB [Sphingobacterium ginsenosidimutans]|uniref:TonB C-terminal domain-containing protein n=1 Tax=Sphingobacterium ginsenosidimutans TaxID=687845 RepID=A0ABP7ZWU9_9SPHI